MVNYREILRLASQDNRQRQIAANVHSSHHTFMYQLHYTIYFKQVALSSVKVPLFDRAKGTECYLQQEVIYRHHNKTVLIMSNLNIIFDNDNLFKRIVDKLINMRYNFKKTLKIIDLNSNMIMFSESFFLYLNCHQLMILTCQNQKFF